MSGQDLRATFYGRDFGGAEVAQLPVTFRVRRISRRARGGCYRATIGVTGEAALLWRLLDWGRYRVVITNAAGLRVWWGYVRKVEVRDINVTATMDVDGMYNRVAVAYTLTANGVASSGSRATTAWTEDAVAITEFGRRELLETIGGVSEDAAIAKRDRVLAQKRYPAGLVKVDILSAGSTEVSATIQCEGWWWTLDWLYANVPTQVAAAFQTIGTLQQAVGRDDGDDVDELLQIITTGPSGFEVLQVALYIKRVGVPAGSLSVALVELDEDDEPGDTVGSGSIAAGAVAESYGWVLATFSSSAALAASTRYGIRVAFSGTLDADDYYVLALDAGQGYAGGVLRRHLDAGDWETVSADMPFRLQTDVLVASDQQILNLCTAYGQFFTRVAVDGVTGVALESYRSGDNDALYEIDELMDTGIAAGARMLAEVDHNRQVRIYAQPDETSAEVYLRRDGNFYRRDVERIDPTTCPAGFWARLASVIPTGVSTGRISGLSAFFVEESEYDAERGVLTYVPLGAEDIRDFGPEAG